MFEVLGDGVVEMDDGEIWQFRMEGMRTADGGIRLRLFLKTHASSCLHNCYLKQSE